MSTELVRSPRRRPLPPDDALAEWAARRWREEGVAGVAELARIARTTPAHEPAWESVGALDDAVSLVAGWAARLGLRGLTLGVVRAPGRSPVLVLDVAADPSAAIGPVLLLGHLDTVAGSPDAGWAPFAALAAVAALQDAERAHPRCVVVLETAGESGSPELSPLLDALRTRLPPPAAILSLDGAAPDGERLWLTVSLRGALALTLAVGASPGESFAGRLASPVRVVRELLDRVECPRTGRILVDALHVDLPGDARAQAAATARELGHRCGRDLEERILDATWRPAIDVVGADGLPPVPLAGAAAPAELTLALAVRLPPTCDAPRAGRALVDRLVADPPLGARVRCTVTAAVGGWRADPAPPWLRPALARASRVAFGAPDAAIGAGGSSAAVRLLADAFPDAPLLVTGAPRAADEGLDLDAAERLAAALAGLLAAAAERPPTPDPASKVADWLP